MCIRGTISEVSYFTINYYCVCIFKTIKCINFNWFYICFSTLQVGKGLKRTNTEELLTSGAKIARPSSPVPGSSSSETANVSSVPEDNLKVECPTCKIFVTKRYLSNHYKSNIHKNNILKTNHALANVTLVESAFRHRIQTFKILSNTDREAVQFETPEVFFDSVRETISILIDDCVKELRNFKVNFILHADFVQEVKGINNSFDFQTCNFIISEADDIDMFLSSLRETLLNKISNFEKKDSGWSLKEIKHIEMNVNKYTPLRGSSYIPLPRDILLKKAVINVRNNDNQCFKWALLSALFPVEKNSDRVTSYSRHSNKIKFGNVSFPVQLKDIKKIELLNNISINVFGLEFNEISKKHTIVGPLHFTKSRKSTHINLLYINEGANGHYCYIKNLSRLVSKQVKKSDGAIHICDGCLLYFASRDRLEAHQVADCKNIRTDLPSKDEKRKNWLGELIPKNSLSFDKYQHKMKVPFVVYADFEAFLNPIDSCANDPTKSHTTNVQKHEVYSFGYYIKCSYDERLSKYETYSGPDCAKIFLERLLVDIKQICSKNRFQKCPKPLSSECHDIISQTSTCFICEKVMDENKIIDYDWHTGDFRGVGHQSCIDKFRAPNYIPVFLHNLSNYDAHFIVHALNFVEGEIQIIPQNKEKYISFSKQLLINNQTVSLRFVDSFKFLSCSLEKLAKNLEDDQFVELKKAFPSSDDFTRLRRKGVYPYEYMTSYELLKLTSLPNKEHFYSSLLNCHVSDDDYSHAQDVWKHFQCCNMSDYSDLYLKTDVLLLADVFENFRELCMKTYDLDPAHYYTAPGLSWDAMLKYTKIDLELLTDFDQIAFVKSGIRGGVSQCSNRYAKANNKYMEEYNTDLPDSYLAYFDANNLYGWAMSQMLPTGGFKWVDTTVDFNISDSSAVGYILEVDLEYPKELHDQHSDLPLCPENLCFGDSKEAKLIPNLCNKTKYIIHYRNLKQCLALGLKLVKVHRVLQFDQSTWLKKYIDLNTHLRTLSKSDFEKDFYKLMNNSVFGKTMENIEKRVNVKLVTHWENLGRVFGAESLVARPEFHSLSIFSDSLVAVQLRKTKLVYNKPIYLGFCILDLSKTLMYDFHYEYMLKKFDRKIKLLYTDTDSLIYQIFTTDFYADIKPDLSIFFDTSDYPSNNIFGYPQINKKKLGFFKDENSGKIFEEFVGLRSKMYAINVENRVLAKAKGVNKCITKAMSVENYKSCLFDNNVKTCEMYRFRSLKHVIFTQKISKICLSSNDTKRYILPNRIDTLAWGHYKIM